MIYDLIYLGAESDVDEPSGGEISEEVSGNEDEDGNKKRKKLPKKKKLNQKYAPYYLLWKLYANLLCLGN